MKRHLELFPARRLALKATSVASLCILFALAACGYGNNDKAKFAPRPPGGGGGRKTDEKATQPLPLLADDDLRVMAMEELTRIYRTSQILLAGEQTQDHSLNCITYRRVKTGDQFLRATYDKCSWERSLGGQLLKWVMGANGRSLETFSANQKTLMARLSSEITAQIEGPATLVQTDATEDFGEGGKRGQHKNTYLRSILIQFPSDTASANHPLQAASGIGIETQTKVDYWRTNVSGYWSVQNSRINSGNLQVTVSYRSGTGTGKRDFTRLVFTPLSSLTFEGEPCARPKGAFAWAKWDGDKKVDNGEFDVDKDGLMDHKGTRPVLRWPKSCMEFPAHPN